MRRIAIDFDGTLVEEKWPEVGDWLPGAVDALKRLAKEYDEVVLFSCRVAEFETDEETPRNNLDQLNAINLMLTKAEVPLNVYIWTRPFKPPADFYVDDKAIRFNGNWDVTTAAVVGASIDIANDPRYQCDSVEGAVSRLGNGDDAERDALLRASLRIFDTGATRDTEDGKLDYEGFLSPLVLRRYAEYMHKHRIQSNGSLRSSDNWQKGIPLEAYMKSGFRHFMDWWTMHRTEEAFDEWGEEAICALIFNASGYLHELLVR